MRLIGSFQRRQDDSCGHLGVAIVLLSQLSHKDHLALGHLKGVSFSGSFSIKCGILFQRCL